MEFRPEHFITDVSGKYPRLWALKGANPNDVRRWYRFRALISICIIALGFWEISELPDWVDERGYDQCDQVSKFPLYETAKTGQEGLTYIKEQVTKPKLVVNLTKDEISTRRAWGVWVYLTEMDKVKYPFKIYQNSVNRSFLLNTMIGSTTRFVNDMFEQKKAMIWENKLIGTENTRRKTCNMMIWSQYPEPEKVIMKEAKKNFTKVYRRRAAVRRSDGSGGRGWNGAVRERDASGRLGRCGAWDGHSWYGGWGNRDGKRREERGGRPIGKRGIEGSDFGEDEGDGWWPISSG
ncbi:hypothetical protein ACS0TY_008227 [Phlomoides rotata]